MTTQTLADSDRTFQVGQKQRPRTGPDLSVDFRNGPPTHWALAGEFETRAHFVLNESDTTAAHLVIEKVTQYDEALYRCRIDYIDAPTKNYKVNLTVIVPPDPPRIYDS
ncbi:unnamed protein product [Pieris macdunnoughi]|uniref:Ig-like domain-containing protein n=1 Tax=Pieris macdunnoughi TaxID=345717 RepID=A0A821NZE3_9NEOP|nr:unnamed protein product [Pieris macdunnoughi]